MPPKLNRETQLQQIRRRYENELVEFDLDDGTLLNFTIECSDPEHNTESIQVVFKVPFEYTPESCRIKMRVVDKNLGDLAKSIIESKFNDIQGNLTLLRYTQWIDRQLPEIFEKKVKFVVPDHTNSMPITKKINDLDLNKFEILVPKSERSDFDIEAADSSSDTETVAISLPDEIANNPHKGTMISYPDVQLKNISIFDVMNLSILGRCYKCKSAIKCDNISPKFALIPDTPTANKRSISCKICGVICQITFRPTFGLRDQGKCGYLDLVNVIFLDILPSTYRIQCEECASSLIVKKWLHNTAYNTRCRECHKEMELDLGQYIALSIGHDVQTKDLGLGKTISQKKQKEKKDEGILFGQPLPKNGACSHYNKSHRWLRFPCCGKAYPCDICHDKHEDHSAINAPKQICGYCSMEQNSNLTNCKSCTKELAKTNSSSFWNGGEGTRDPTKMSRNDSKKYRGLGKVKSNAAMKKNKK